MNTPSVILSLLSLSLNLSCAAAISCCELKPSAYRLRCLWGHCLLQLLGQPCRVYFLMGVAEHFLSAGALT